MENRKKIESLQLLSDMTGLQQQLFPAGSVVEQLDIVGL
jgi:hypothetical protein